MKAPSFWYRPFGPRAFFLYPAAMLYRAISGRKRVGASAYQSKIPVICIGNIVAGGAGKTPTAKTLAERHKHQQHKPALVTRANGGKEHGPERVDPERHTSRDVGDEALLLARTAPVWVGRDRPAAIKQAEKHATHIILDDGLQNTSVQPGVSFLVIDGETGLGNGCVMPAGPLRERLDDILPRVAAVILIGKYSAMIAKLTKAGMPENRIIRARLQPKISARFPRERTFFAFAGIGHPDKFYRTCYNAGLTLTGTHDFPDHHNFTARELKLLEKQADDRSAQLLTTEKDWVRLPPAMREEVLTVPVVLQLENPDVVKRLISAACQKKAAE